MNAMEDQQLIIRNSKGVPREGNYIENLVDIPADELSATLDDGNSLHAEATLSVVRLIESSEGKHMLDFGDENDAFVASFLSNHTEQRGDSDNDMAIFIEAESLKHLQVFAELSDVKLSFDKLEVQPANLQHPFQHHKTQLQLLPNNVQEVLRTLLPLETLFSWSTLVRAREEGILQRKDIRNFLARVKRSVPFVAPDSDGLLHHIIHTHLTFHQFVAFAKLVENSLQQLPMVKVKVCQASTLSVDLLLTPAQNCTTICRIACMNENESPPSAQQMKDCATDSMFVSCECVQLVAGETKIVRLGGLKEGTVYDSYIHLSRPSSDFPVESTDTDVMNSHFKIETSGYQLMDVFPVFDSMTMEEQRIELVASIKDKSVRLSAQADGLVIPGVDEEHDDNQAWQLYTKWWKDNLGIRYDFCMRELIFASKDEGVRRNARKDGISMSHSGTKGKQHEQWARAFGNWYYDAQSQGGMPSDGSFQQPENAVHRSSHPVQTLEVRGVNETKQCGLMPTFQSKMNKMEVKGEEVDEAESIGDVLLLTSFTRSCRQSEALPPTPPTEFELGAVTRNEATDKCDSLDTSSNSPDTSDDSFDPTVLSVNSTAEGRVNIEATQNVHVSNTGEELPIPSKPSKTSRLTIGVVGSVVSFRQRFLRRLSTRIDTCLALTRPKTPSSLRGISLFRAKVRLVMLLLKVSNKPFSSLNDVDIFSYPQRERRNTNSAPITPINEEEVDDDTEDEELMSKARDHCEDRLVRNVFRIMRNRAQEVAAEKRAQEEKASVALKAFHSLLLRKSFQAFVEALRSAKASAAESVVEDIIGEAAPDPPKVQVEQSCVDDDDSVEFVSHWNADKNMPFCRVNYSSDVDLIINEARIEFCKSRGKIKPLDEETLTSMRRAKRMGASNLYDVPEYLLCYDNNLAEERPIDSFRNTVHH